MTQAAAYDPRKEELVHIAGDMKKGISTTYDLAKSFQIGEPLLRYRDTVIECEVYEVDGMLSVITICPKCHKILKIEGANKKIEYDRKKNLLFVEKFKCPWEMGGPDDHTNFGVGACNLKLAYDGNVARDA